MASTLTGMGIRKARELLMLMRSYGNDMVMKKFKGITITTIMLEIIRRYGSCNEATVTEERVAMLHYAMNPALLIQIMQTGSVETQEAP